MKKNKGLLVMALAASVWVLAGCSSFSGQPILDGSSDHKLNVGGDLNDTLPLSVQVREALRGNPQTALARIQVSSNSEDTVQLSGSVDNDAIKVEAERVAGSIPGVRFVVNTLNVERR